MTDGYPMLLGTLKELDSNVRSEISYLDRNLTNNGNTNTAAIVQNSANIGTQGRETTLKSADTIINDSRRNMDSLSGTLERQNIYSQSMNESYFKDLKDTTQRSSDYAMNDNRRVADFSLSDSRRNSDFLSNAVERNGTAGQLATERVGGYNLSENIRNAGQIRDLVNHQSTENRTQMNALSSQSYQLARDAAIAAKDTDLKVADAAFKAQLQGSVILNDMGKIKSDLEKQAAQYSALAARDMAYLSRDVLNSKGEIMRQASDNTASIQLEAMKNKDSLQYAIHCTYDKLSSLNTDRIRDNLNDYRSEATGLKYGDEYGRNDIHNNLYSNYGHEHHRERDVFPGPGPRP